MIDERIAMLEKQVRRLHRVLAVLAVGFVWLIVWRLVPGPDTLEAREFRMLGPGGTVRGAFGMLPDGRPILRLNDKNGKARAMLYLDQERGGGLRIMDTDGERRIEMVLHPTGDPELRILNSQGRPRTLLRLDQPDRAAVWVNDDEGARIWASPGAR